MQPKEFWNKAIEYYSTHNIIDNKEGFKTVFIAIAEESLVRIKERFIEDGGLSEEEVAFVEGAIGNAGGTIDSYYSAINDVHQDLRSPGQYSFLRFSILVLGAFKQDDSPLKNYWKDFNPFLKTKNIPVISDRTYYLEGLISNLSKCCKIKHNKTFFQLNVFGENSFLVNVGRIKAHSVFQGRTLEKIKKSIYSLGYSDSHSIEDLTYRDVEEIILDSGLDRILKLFKKDEDAKEIVFACLKIWLNQWSPSQEEKVRLLEGETSTKKAPLSILRLWEINRDHIKPHIEIKIGFIYKSELGENSKYYLNREENVFVDTTWGIKLSGDRTLYEINNYNYNSDLNDNELGLRFDMINAEITETNYALEKVPNRPLFIEHFKKKNLIKENPFVLATRHDLNSDSLAHFFRTGLKDSPENMFNLYRITGTYSHADLNFITTQDIEISIIGISDGRSGVKSYDSFCPIRLKIGSASRGEVQLFFNHNDKVFKSFPLSELYDNLNTEIDVGLLERGKYSIKFFLNDVYVNFDNGKNSIDFEIVDSGVGDRRVEPQNIGVESFDYHEFRRLKEFNSLESNAVILHDGESVFNFDDQHFDFYFIKDENGCWVDLSDNRNRRLRRKMPKLEFFLQRTSFRPEFFYPLYSTWKIPLVYLDTNFNQFKYSIQFSERPLDVKLPFIMDKFFIKNEERIVINDYVNVKCYCYKIVEMDDGVKKKYPNLNIGDEICILSNKLENNKPEKLIQLVNQEYFPFKPQIG